MRKITFGCTSAVRHMVLLMTLLFGFGLAGVYAQSTTSEIPAGLKMKKKFVPANDDNTAGQVVLETYVTGSEITSSVSVPNDIVIIVDQSGSMSDSYGSGQTRLAALKSAVTTFCENVQQDAASNNVNHKIAIVGFASGYTGYNSYSNYYGYYNQRWNWTNTELLSTQTEIAYGSATSGACAITTQNYQDALVLANNNGNVNSRLTTAIDRMAASGGTCMQYGLEMAYGVLSNRTETEFSLPDGTKKPRGQIVIFFTDGYPGLMFPTASAVNAPSGQDGRFAQGYGDNGYRDMGYGSTPRYVNYNEIWSSANIADAAVTQTNNLKTNGATVFAVGIFDGANPTQAYQTNQYDATVSNHDYYYWQPNSTGVNGDPAANGLMHMISSNYDNKNGAPAAMPTSWSSATTSSANVANRFVEHEYTDSEGNTKTWTPKYFAAGNPDDLNAVFSDIAGQSGAEPIELDAATIVQDEVSANFTLPEGADISDIEVYAVKCTGGEVNAQNEATAYYFNTPGGDEFGTKTTMDGDEIQYLTLNADGVVVEGDNLPENRLESTSDLVQITTNSDGNKQIALEGFNFTNMFCGPIIVNNQVTGWEGRKLVIKIPIEVADGVWGDGVTTNGPMSFVLPDGGTVAYEFECPNVNVMGSVWTEVVTEEPENFDPMNIDSPEDLAWFISRVNGRVNYNANNTIASDPDLDGRLTADIDMSAHNWVPIGCGYQCDDENNFITDAQGRRIKLSYDGEFDGNGHVVTGLKNNASKFYKVADGGGSDVVVFPGMFSNVTGTVHDVFILDSDFRGKHHNSSFIHHGILADTLSGGTIYNCEAAGRITCNNDKPNQDANLIYGGLVGLNDGGTIYNAMAMAELTCYTMGGMIGENRGSFSNGFTNGLYKYLGADNTYKVGGITAINTSAGSIDNCYVRFERYNENLDKATFDQIVPDNSGTKAHCYTQQLVTWSQPSVTSVTTSINTNTTVPNTITTPGGNPSDSYTLPVNRTFFNMFSNDNMTGGAWGTTEVSGNTFNVYKNGTTLADVLTEHKGDGASWKRTTAGSYDVAHGSGDINDDFPVLQLPGYTCLASADGIRIDYGHTLKEVLHRHNSGALNEHTSLTGKKYRPTGHATINGGSINLYVNDDVTLAQGEDSSYESTDTDVVVYIDEDISLLQGPNSTIEAYTGQTLKSFVPDGNERWHYVSSSMSDSKFGWSYGTTTQVEYSNAANPCNFSLSQVDEDHALFPIDLISYYRADFYCFYEKMYHWINFRRNSLSHWHMDLKDNSGEVDDPDNHAWIDYVNELGAHENEDHFIPGKGYLMAVQADYWSSEGKDAQFLQNRGMLTNGTKTINVTAEAPEWTYLTGYNLLGNPYQSFLDFDVFASVNAERWNQAPDAPFEWANTYAVYDPSTNDYLQYMAGSSKGSMTAPRYINMHQGFMVHMSNPGQVQFTNDMRSNDTIGEVHFRGVQPAFPLINFILTDSEGKTDLAILELNRAENTGAEKLRVGSPAGRIYFRYNDENLAIFFRDNAKDYQSLNFAAEEDGVFTLSWKRANDDFNSLTLIDNITGVKTDMLTHDHYIFEGSTQDYRTRFKIVFEFNNDDEQEEVATENFAFFNNDNLVVNGTGIFEVVDVMGRVLYATELFDSQSTISMPASAKGVCLLRLTNGSDVKVQKVMVR